MAVSPSSVNPVREPFGPLGEAWRQLVGAQECIERATDALQRANAPRGLLAWSKLAEDALSQLRVNVERERTRGGEAIPQADGAS